MRPPRRAGCATCSAQYASFACASSIADSLQRRDRRPRVGSAPVCAAPSARAKYVIASVYGNCARLGSSAAAAFQSRRSSAHRAGIAASAKTPADPGAAARGVGIEPRAISGIVLQQRLHGLVLAGLQVRVDDVVHRVQFFRRRARLARAVGRHDVGVDRFLPGADARERVRRHVQRVRRRRRDRRVACAPRQRAIRQRRHVVAVNDVVRDAGMIGLLGGRASRGSPRPSADSRRSCRSAAPTPSATAPRRSTPRDHPDTWRRDLAIAFSYATTRVR